MSIRVSADSRDRPGIAFNRWSEDWTVLSDPAVPREPLDALKYIPLSKRDPSTYISFGANIRERFELNDANFGTGGGQQDSYLLSRAEAHADLRVVGHVQVFLQLQSDTAPGKKRLSPVDQDRLGVEQGFVALSENVSDGVVAIRIGRQENGFDLQRFLSVRDGPNVRQSYDGVSVAYTRGPWRLITLYTDPVQNRTPGAFSDFSSPALSLGLVRIERTLSTSASLSAYVGRFRQDNARFPSASGGERRDLMDVRFTGVSGRVDWDTETMFQGGRMGGEGIRAWATGTDIGLSVSSIRFRPRISLQVDAASGDKSPTDHQLNTFNPLFPSGHYFTTAGYTTYANVVHVKTSLSLNPLTTVKLSSGIGVEWRQTLADAIYTLPTVPVPGTPGHGGRFVGAYGQLRADCGLTHHISVGLELVHFSAGATIVSVGGHDTNYAGLDLRYGW